MGAGHEASFWEEDAVAVALEEPEAANALVVVAVEMLMAAKRIEDMVVGLDKSFGTMRAVPNPIQRMITVITWIRASIQAMDE